MLDTVLAERSVVRAARRLHVTPSAVSNALARLRAALDDPLLIRSGRGVVPTPRAAALAPALGARPPRSRPGRPRRRLRSRRRPIASSRWRSPTSVQVVKLPAIVAALGGDDAAGAAARPQHRHAVRARAASAGRRSTSSIGAGEKGPGVHAQPLFEERDRAGRARRPSRASAGGSRKARARRAPPRRGSGRAGAGQAGRWPRAMRRWASRATSRSWSRPSPRRPRSSPPPTSSRRCRPAWSTCWARGWACGGSPRRCRAVGTTINLLWHERTHQDPALRAFRDLLVRVLRRPVARGRQLAAGGLEPGPPPRRRFPTAPG